MEVVGKLKGKCRALGLRTVDAVIYPLPQVQREWIEAVAKAQKLSELGKVDSLKRAMKLAERYHYSMITPWAGKQTWTSPSSSDLTPAHPLVG